MLGQLPCELRLYIFKIVFCDATFGRGLVHVTRNGGDVHFEFTDDYLRNEFGGAISCLEARSIGKKTAAAVIEALCGYEFVFTVPARISPRVPQPLPAVSYRGARAPNQEASCVH